MKDEEMAEEQKLCLKAQSFKEDVKAHDIDVINAVENKLDAYKVGRYEGFLAGLKAGRPQWHKVSDGDLPKGEEYGKNSIHRDIYLKDRYGNLYTGNYFPKDKNHTEDCFAVEVLEWGFQGSQFCKKEQISEWCEIPTFDKE